MRYPSGELSDRIHLLRLGELLFEPGLVGEVPHCVDEYAGSERGRIDLKDAILLDTVPATLPPRGDGTQSTALIRDLR